MNQSSNHSNRLLIPTREGVSFDSSPANILSMNESDVGGGSVHFFSPTDKIPDYYLSKGNLSKGRQRQIGLYEILPKIPRDRALRMGKEPLLLSNWKDARLYQGVDGPLSNVPALGNHTRKCTTTVMLLEVM